MIIKSAENKIFKYALKLQDKKFRAESKLFLIEGKKQIEEIPENWNIKQIFISERYKNTVENFKNIITFSERLFSKLSATKSPQGIIAAVEKKFHNVKEITKNTGPFVILENIQDPGNLGTIIRSADAFGLKAVFVSKGSADIYSDKTLRAAAGSIFRLPVIDDITIENILNLMNEEKIFVFAASLKGEKYLNDIKFADKSAFIIGNEGHGIKSETENSAAILVKVRTLGKTRSLNAAVAASVIMYEISKKL
ncbi:MAG: RNA methyltransferase [Endomicrobium sp.]|jgi:TrmH family RNA methyltransferase|nr:RNA methyltransferase [Endomicrobium sp.]